MITVVFSNLNDCMALLFLSSALISQVIACHVCALKQLAVELTYADSPSDSESFICTVSTTGS